MKRPGTSPAPTGASLLLSVLVVLREKRPEVAGFLLVLDAGEHHFGAWNLRLGVLDVVLELGLVPGDAGILVGIRVGIALRRAGVAAVEPVEFRADLVLGAFADRVTGHAFIERSLADRDVLRERYGGRERRCDGNQRAQCQPFHYVLFMVSVGDGLSGRGCLGRSRGRVAPRADCRVTSVLALPL